MLSSLGWQSPCDNNPAPLHAALQQCEPGAVRERAVSAAPARSPSPPRLGCSHMLVSCTPAARKVVMMDVRGFKEKADRCALRVFYSLFPAASTAQRRCFQLTAHETKLSVDPAVLPCFR